MKKGIRFNSVGFIVLIAAVVLAVFIAFCSATVVPTGYTGVRSTFGKIDEKPVGEGLQWHTPFIQSIRLVCNKQTDQEYRDKIWSETSNRTAVYYEGTIVTTSISADKSAWLVANVADYKNAVTSGMVQSAIKSASKGFEDVDATNRSMIEPKALEYLQKAIDEKYGEGVITVNRVVITNADFDDDYNNAIAAKQRAKLNAETQEIENQKNVAKAEADKKVAMTLAEGQAEAKKIEAQGQAEANRLLQESITPNILEDKKLEKWDGKLPVYVVGDSSSTGLIFDMGTGAAVSDGTE